MARDGGDRVLHLDGLHNFRDFGGYAVAGGGRIRRGVLWRSGQHAGASDADLERIAALDLKAVFDLRTDKERREHPCRRPAGFAGMVYHAEDKPTGATAGAPAERPAAERMAPHVAAAMARPNDAPNDAGTRQRTAESTRAMMRQSYLNIPFRPTLVLAMRAYLATLADLDGASLVNCMAGKDRTGIAVAMLHHALGAHEDDIMADYLLTNTAGDQQARIASGMASIRSVTGELPPDVLRVMMGVEADYLHTAWQAIRERHGSVETYLAEVLGADEALRDRLKARLIAS